MTSSNLDRVRGAALDAGLQAVLVTRPADLTTEIESNDWVLVTANEAFLRAIQDRIRAWTPVETPVLWTDRRTSLFRVLRH